MTQINNSRLSSTCRGTAFIAFSTFIWSATGPVEKHLLHFLTPVALAFGAIFFAASFLMIAGRLSPRYLYNVFRKKPFVYLGLGLTGFALAYPLIFTALVHLPLGVVAPLIKLQAVFIMFFSAFFLQEKITLSQILLSLSAILCAVLVTVPLNQLMRFEIDNMWAFWAGFGAALSFCFSGLFGKTALNSDARPIDVAMLRFVIGFTLLIPYILISGDWQGLTNLPGKEWLIVILLGITSDGIGLILYYKGMKRISLSLATVFEMVQVIFSVILGFIFLHERLQLSQYLAIIGLLGAIMALVLKEDRALKIAETPSHT